MAGSLRLVIRQVLEARAPDVKAFYQAHPGEFLFPRTVEDLQVMAADQSLVEIVDETGAIAAVCYTLVGDDCSEFGGVLVTDAHRGKRVADFLGALVLAFLFMTTRPTKLIAHVHVKNPAPRKLLARLGFKETGIQELIPKDKPVGDMLKDENGDVVGDVFDFPRESLADIVLILEAYRQVLGGVPTEIQGELRDLPTIVAALRSILAS